VTADAERRHRPIRSFVLRQGRLTKAQKAALEAHWPTFGLDWPRPAADPADWFAVRRPVVLEIGFGNGEAMLTSALADRSRNHLGIEVHRPGVGRLLRELAPHQLDNAKVIVADAVEVLTQGILPGTLDEVRLYFPDPWHKTRHHKRRIVQPAFVDLIGSRLRPGGRFHLATDWAPYAEWMREVLSGCAALRPVAEGEAVAARRAQTHFERRGLKLGHPVADFLFERVA
jgi:tRNA (guanine-N7-)-methyltransferase